MTIKRRLGGLRISDSSGTPREITLSEYDDWLDEIPEHFVRAAAHATRALEEALDTALERDMQRILQAHPILLIRFLAGQGFLGMTPWGDVVPQKRLGSEFVPDFLVGTLSSGGTLWRAVELESPKVPMFTKAGDPSRYLVHAIRQIQDWRAWLELNQAYAARARAEHGLGLSDISSSISGLILIGRRQNTNPATNGLRRRMMVDLDIQIRTYDALLGGITMRSSASSNLDDLAGS